MPPAPAQLKSMPERDLAAVAEELRARILAAVAAHGGHLASNLGAVELTIALHAVFDIPATDTLYFDVGHQAYAHKLLTGRTLDDLREEGGVSGFPSPDESPADPVYAGHAGVAVSQALGDAEARLRDGRPGKAIAVIGDGALSCGIPWEALNNLRDGGRRLVIVLNDNQMSISPARGTLRHCLNRIISGRFYNRVRAVIKTGLGAARPGRLRSFWLRIERAVKGFFLPPGILFQELGLRYFGPIDGHSLPELLRNLRLARDDRSGNPLLIHIVTRKGCGCPFAEQNPSRYHGVGPFDPATGETAPRPKGEPDFSRAFGDAICSLAQEHPEVVAVSAAMLDGTGLADFARRFPDRCHDTGIAEEHAVAFASGLARGGERPVVAIYSTFLQRAFDNLYHDVCLNRLPVIFAVDRAGAVPDGPTHHGIYDLGFLRQLPDLVILAPATAAEVKAMLYFAYSLKRPALLRYPRGRCLDLGRELQPVELGRAVLLRAPEQPTRVLWATGAMLETALQVAGRLDGERVAVVNARFLKPFDADLARRFADIPQASIEDHCVIGGLGDCLLEALADLPHPPVQRFGWPADAIIPHGNPASLRARFGLDADAIADRLRTPQ